MIIRWLFSQLIQARSTWTMTPEIIRRTRLQVINYYLKNLSLFHSVTQRSSRGGRESAEIATVIKCIVTRSIDNLNTVNLAVSLAKSSDSSRLDKIAKNPFGLIVDSVANSLLLSSYLYFHLRGGICRTAPSG